MKGVLVPLLLSTAVVACQGTSVVVLSSEAAGDACPAAGVEGGRPVEAGKEGDAGAIEAGTADGGVDGKSAHGGTWPTYAHDLQRTSRSEGAGQMTVPEVAWSMKMGGLLSLRQASIGDVDGDGRPNVVAVTGGRVTASQPDGTPLWQGDLVGAFAVSGIWNLDGAGAPEVVVETKSGISVLDGVDGHAVAAIPLSLQSTIAFVPVAPTGGLLIVGSAGQLAAYDFRGGLQASTPLWTITSENETEVLPGDIDGDGVTDLVRPVNAGFQVLDVLTGLVKYAANPMGPAAYFYVFQLADVDGVAGQEIVAIDTSYVYSPTCGIYVLGVKQGALVTLWSSTQAPAAALDADFYAVSGAVADLDGDGTQEVVYSQWDSGPQSWSTLVADAASGTLLATIPGQIVQAIADVDGDGKPEITVRASPLANKSPARSDLRVYDFDSRSAPPAAKTWVQPLAHVEMLSSVVQTRQGEPDVPVAANLDPAAGTELLIGSDVAQTDADGVLSVLRGADGSLASKYPVASRVTPSLLGWVDALSSPSSKNDLVEYGNDGAAHVLGGSLTVGATFSVGTYANWVDVYGLDDARTVLAMATSNLDLVWVDGTHLHADGSPYGVVRASGVVDTSSGAATGFPQDPLTYLGGPSPALVASVQGETGVALVAFDISGIQTWRMPLAAGTQILSPGAYAYDFTGDGTPDLVLPTEDVAGLESISIVDGATGAVVRSTPLTTIIAGGDQTATGSLFDVNGDGTPDLVTPLHSIGDVAIDLSADPMRTVWSVPYDANAPRVNGTIAALPADASGTGLLRFDGNNGFGWYAHYSPAGVVVATEDQGLLEQHGQDTNAVAFVERTKGSGTYDMVSAGTAGAGLSRVRRLAGDTLDVVWTQYLIGGQVTQTPPVAPVALRDPIELDVDGDGTEEVVLGSDDGWIYALHATDGSKAFALDLGAPVSHVIAADVDLDPALEIEASLSDGRLVAIDQHGSYATVRDAPDAGTVAPEAGVDAAGDAAVLVEAGSCVPTATQPAEHTGCSCRTSGVGDEREGAASMLLVVGAVALRRRRRSGAPVDTPRLA